MRGVCPPATSLRYDCDLHARRSRMRWRRCTRATYSRGLGSVSLRLGSVHTSCGCALPLSAIKPPGGNLDLGVDFFLRIDRLNPDQHPAWISGSGLIVGEGMIMAEVGEGFNLRLSDLHNYVCCGVFGVHENPPTLRGPRPQTRLTRRDHPIPARAPRTNSKG